MYMQISSELVDDHRRRLREDAQIPEPWLFARVRALIRRLAA
jgi:hypothetical protein